MGAFLILFLVAVYIFIAFKVTALAKSWFRKLVVILVFTMIPTADGIYGRIKFEQMCKDEAGLKIFKTVENVEGFYIPEVPPSEEWIRIYGYKFVEGGLAGGILARMSLSSDGSILLESDVTPISKYVYEYTLGNPRNIYYGVEKRIRVIENNEILSKFVNISYAGGWWERFIASIYASRGQAGMCGTSISITEIVTKTLKPPKEGGGKRSPQGAQRIQE